MIKTILFGYRDWAFQVFDSLKSNRNLEIIDVIISKEDYDLKINKIPDNVDFLLFLGWSWIIPANITTSHLCLGIHPSNLPDFRGGSPLQHQILAGLETTKVTLMTLSSEKLDAGDIWLKEDLNLKGNNMTEVFGHLVKSTVLLLNKFIENFGAIKAEKQIVSTGSYYRRRLPEQSRISIADLTTWDLKKTYNFMRCLTDPYPNAYLEDENGNRLIFKEVEFIPYEQTKF